MSDSDRLTIVEMEYRIVAGRLSVIEAEMAKMNVRLDSIDHKLDSIDDRFSSIDAVLADHGTRLGGVERGVNALLRHFKIGDDQ